MLVLLTLLPLALASPFRRQTNSTTPSSASAPTVTIIPSTSGGKGVELTGIAYPAYGQDVYLGIPFARPREFLRIHRVTSDAFVILRLSSQVVLRLGELEPVLRLSSLLPPLLFPFSFLLPSRLVCSFLLPLFRGSGILTSQPSVTSVGPLLKTQSTTPHSKPPPSLQHVFNKHQVGV